MDQLPINKDKFYEGSYGKYSPIALFLGWEHLQIWLEGPCSESLWRQVR